MLCDILVTVEPGKDAQPPAFVLPFELRLKLKGIVHRKMKMHSLATHHDADGGVGEVCESTEHFWSLRGKQCCSQIGILVSR